MGNVLGYCVVSFNQASGQPEFDLPDLHQDRESARWELEEKEAETDVRLLLAVRGHDTVVTDANAPWLVRSGVMMLAAFGIGTEQELPEITEAGHG